MYNKLFKWNKYERDTKKILSIIYNKKIHIQNIVHWIKNADKILKEEMNFFFTFDNLCLKFTKGKQALGVRK